MSETLVALLEAQHRATLRRNKAAFDARQITSDEFLRRAVEYDRGFQVEIRAARTEAAEGAEPK